MPEQTTPSSAEPQPFPANAALPYGFIGAGEITAAIVEGLSSEAAEPPPVFLSPRGREVGRDLAIRFPNVRVCGSNQEVLENAATILIAVRPQLAHDALAELSFRDEHVVLSAVAGIPLRQLSTWAAPAHAVVRTIPLPQASHRQSLTVVYPDHDAARALFTPVGGVLVPGDESALEVFSAATATFAAHLDYLATIAAWMADQGVDADDAAAYTAHVFGQVGRSLTRSDDAIAELSERHGTPGGINEQLRDELRGQGVPDAVRQALDGILVRVRGT